MGIDFYISISDLHNMTETDSLSAADRSIWTILYADFSLVLVNHMVVRNKWAK